MRLLRHVVATVLLIGAGFVGAQVVNKIWVHSEYQDNMIHLYFTQDVETGTRCYVVAGVIGGGVNGSTPVAISCVPQH